MKELRINIEENGKVVIDAIGFNGKECLLDTKELEKALGQVIDRDLKPEYDRRVATKQEQKARNR